MNSGLVGALGAAPLRVIGMIKRVIASSPNADVNALQLLATGGSKNVDLVLTPKGTGAFIAGPAPDGTIIGGNKRGIYAFDNQRSRYAASLVASGPYSVICGGYDNVAPNSRSIVVGGFQNNASGEASFIGGGGINSAGYLATIAGGYVNAASNQFTVIGGGFYNIASGQYSTIAGGSENTSSGSYSVASGNSAKSELYGKFAHAAGSFAARGDAQLIRLVARIKTTNNTATEMRLDGSTTRLAIASGTSIHATIKIIGIKSDGTSVATYIRQAAIKNVAGTTSLVGDIITIGNDTAAGTSVSITADDTNDALKIDVTGITSETWRWVATVEGVEVAYGT